MPEEIPKWFQDMMFDIEFLRNVGGAVGTTEAVYGKYQSHFKETPMCGWTTGQPCTCTDGTGETVECPHA